MEDIRETEKNQRNRKIPKNSHGPIWGQHVELITKLIRPVHQTAMFIWARNIFRHEYSVNCLPLLTDGEKMSS